MMPRRQASRRRAPALLCRARIDTDKHVSRLLAPVMMTFAVACAAPSPMARATDSTNTRPPKVAPRTMGILSELRTIARSDWWPDFDVTRTPLAIYDGEATYLVAHPKPPSGFRPQGDVYVYAGRHPAMVANTAMDIAGVLTASVLLDPQAALSRRDAAALLAHEAFHVFQRHHHPDWVANEVVALAMVHDDVDALTERILETRALRRALMATTEIHRREWATAALVSRKRRFARIGAEAREYERKSELNEGLAQYIQYKAEGRRAPPSLPAVGFAASAVRQRAYAVGAAWAILLDTESPGWKKNITGSLDTLLTEALGRTEPASFTEKDRANAKALAKSKASEHLARIATKRMTFLDRSGAQVIVDVPPDQPLQTAGFDPLNVLRIGPREVLHTRFLKLTNDRVSLEVLNHPARTLGVGPHPLFSGVRQFELRGLTDITVSTDEATTKVRAEGIRIDVQDAVVATEGPTTRISLRAPADNTGR